VKTTVKTTIFSFFLLILLIVAATATSVQANPSLVLTVKTDKQEYYAKDPLFIYGNLTLDEVLVTDGLVGLQLQTSEDKLLTIRTLTTGTLPPTTPYVKLWNVAPCNSSGGPKFSFKRGTLAYFKTEVTNYDIEPRAVLITVNTYYSDNTPFGSASVQTTLSPESTSTFIISIPIPTDAVLGTASAYANAYTDWPKQGGTAYCYEVKAIFEIVDSETSSQTIQGAFLTETNQTGNFNLTLKLPKKAPYGNYTIYVTARYLGEEVFNTTTFEVYILGDLGGGIPPEFFNFDGVVDGKDLALFIQCYKELAPPEAMYLADLGGGMPPEFFNFDGVVDGKDLALFIQCYKGQGP